MVIDVEYKKDNDPNYLKGYISKVVRRKEKKVDVDKVFKEIKDFAKEGKVVIGTNRVTKESKRGNMKKVYFSSNVSDEVKKELEYYSKISGFEIELLSYSSSEFGAKLEKPFLISVLGILK